MSKETPILFTGGMVRAILDGRKTQTRRIVKLPKDRGTWEQSLFEGSQCVDSKGRPGRDMVCISNTTTGKTIACPYGQPGEYLWVRETWAIGFSTDNAWHATDDRIKSIAEPQRYSRRYAADGTKGFWGKWRPSIFMPRWACRLRLELTDVRVERLQEITEADAIAEGVQPLKKTAPHCRQFYKSYRLSGDGTFCERTAMDSYRTLWESINGEGSWAANPWVWVLTFRRAA